MIFRIGISLLLVAGFFFTCQQPTNVAHAEASLKYSRAPAINPLKGLVPYSRPSSDQFPHSMEFNYLALSDLVVGENKYNWDALEYLLNDISSRHKHAIFRIWMEYPGKEKGIPEYLVKKGLRVVEWTNTNTAPFPAKKVRTPDYSNRHLRTMLTRFVVELGNRYDGDARIGFITAGLLGTWGEWHTYPRTELMADKNVQDEVMQAYSTAFKKTPVLIRYPAGKDDPIYARNDNQPFGYHDDAFSWETINTGKVPKSWFFLSRMQHAEALEKWKQYPIGGEIKPELWGKIFDAHPSHPQAQDFSECVQQTHVSWLLDSGMFKKLQSAERVRRAKQYVQEMGYEFQITHVSYSQKDNQKNIEVIVKNHGVAPFYHDWGIELGCFTKSGQLVKRIKTNWSLCGILPKKKMVWKANITMSEDQLAVRVINPLPNGIPLMFANDSSLQLGNGWLLLPKR
ncbi:MAG: DUF4832 domain-containing protein [Pirellulales bacterium]